MKRLPFALLVLLASCQGPCTTRGAAKATLGDNAICSRMDNDGDVVLCIRGAQSFICTSRGVAPVVADCVLVATPTAEQP